MKAKLVFGWIMLFQLAWTQAMGARSIQLITPELQQLGRLKEGTVVTDTLLFANRTRSSLRISRIKSSCGCTVPTLDRDILAPGDTARIIYVLNTRGFHGLLRKTLTVEFHETKIEPVTFLLEFQVYNELDIEPRYIHFKDVHTDPDTVLTAAIIVRNYGDVPIRLKRVFAKSGRVKVGPVRARLDPLDAVTLTVRFTPTEPAMIMDYIIIETDHEKNRILEIPVFGQVRRGFQTNHQPEPDARGCGPVSGTGRQPSSPGRHAHAPDDASPYRRFSRGGLAAPACGFGFCASPAADRRVLGRAASGRFQPGPYSGRLFRALPGVFQKSGPVPAGRPRDHAGAL